MEHTWSIEVEVRSVVTVKVMGETLEQAQAQAVDLAGLVALKYTDQRVRQVGTPKVLRWDLLFTKEEA